MLLKTHFLVLNVIVTEILQKLVMLKCTFLLLTNGIIPSCVFTGYYDLVSAFRIKL